MTDDITSRCPKHMRFGPCGGVHHDRTCEVDRRPCPFVTAPGATPPTDAPSFAREPPRPAAHPGLGPVIVDVRYPRGAPPASEPSVRRWWADIARALAGCTALLGEHVDNPTTTTDASPLDPSAPVRVLSSHGVPTVATVTGRDRTVTVARRVIARHAAAGARAVHCVTGDHPAALGLDRPARFGAESITLLGNAADAGAAADVETARALEAFPGLDLPSGFHQIDAETQSRIGYQKISKKSGEPVDPDDIQLGYETSTGRYVTFDPDEIDELRPRTTRTIDISDFVDLAEIDPIFYERTYWLRPAGEQDRSAYWLLVAAMEDREQVAIGTVVMRNKQYLAALRPLDGALAMSTMRFADEVVSKSDLDEMPQRAKKPSAKELSLAVQILESLSAPWKPDQYEDTCTETLRDLIERKGRGGEVTTEEDAAPPDAKVLDLMEALQASIDGTRAKRSTAKKAPAKKAPAKRTAAKKTAAKKAPAKKASGKKTPAKRTPAKRAPAEGRDRTRKSA